MRYIFQSVFNSNQWMLNVLHPDTNAVIHTNQYPSYTEMAATGVLVADETLVDLGVMSSTQDVKGYEAYLKEMKIITAGDSLIPEQDHKKEQADQAMQKAIEQLKEIKAARKIPDVYLIGVDENPQAIVQMIADQAKQGPLSNLQGTPRDVLEKRFGKEFVDLCIAACAAGSNYAAGGTIDTDTPIIPEIIADQVAADAVQKTPPVKTFNVNQQSSIAVRLVDYLVDKANTLYKNNVAFRKQITARGNKGRDVLYAFMQHWSEAWINRGKWRYAEGGEVEKELTLLEKEKIGNYADGGMTLDEIKIKRQDRYFAGDYNAALDLDKQWSAEKIKQLAADPDNFRHLYKNFDITKLVVSSAHPLSNILQGITGDGYNSIDYDDGAGLGEVLTHGKTGLQFTVVNEYENKLIKDILYSSDNFKDGGTADKTPKQIFDEITQLKKQYDNSRRLSFGRGYGHGHGVQDKLLTKIDNLKFRLGRMGYVYRERAFGRPTEMITNEQYQQELASYAKTRKFEKGGKLDVFVNGEVMSDPDNRDRIIFKNKDWFEFTKGVDNIDSRLKYLGKYKGKLPDNAFTDDYNGFYDTAAVIKENDEYFFDYEKGGEVKKTATVKKTAEKKQHFKTITVTKKNIDKFSLYQGTIKKLSVGETLYVVKENIPYVTKNATFAIVTDWKPSPNSLQTIKRRNDPDADKYGWRSGAETMIKTLKEKTAENSYAFNRWAVPQKLIPKTKE